MAQQIRDKITPDDCRAYADACEMWAGRAPDEAARTRLIEMGRGWRDLGRHLQGSGTADEARPGKPGRGRPTAKLKPVSRSGSRRPH
jgi:hypothetical protein